MRAMGYIVLGALLLPIVAMGAAMSQTPQPATAACEAGPNALGVSRVVEIDTARGPMFGSQQYRDIDFLKDGEIVLTFDDGPLRSHTMPVLKALDAHCTKATFFVVGKMAIADPATLREVAARGHTIGTHTWSHRNLAGSTAAKAKDEVEMGFSAVSKALGQPIAPFFRFPYLADSKAMISYLGERNIAGFSVDIDSKDYRTRNPAVVQRSILSLLQTQRKGIILFHDIQASTAGALLPLLNEIKARGFKIVHLVPKGTAETVAAYDAMAEKELARRKVATAAQQLAPRSVVWPMTGQDASPSEIITKPAHPVASKVRYGTKEGGPAVTDASAHAQPAPKPTRRPALKREQQEQPFFKKFFD